MSNEVNTNQNAAASPRERWLAIGAFLLIVVAGALGYWFMRGTGHSSLAGRPVPTPDFDVAPPPAGGAVPRPGEMLITIQPDKLENAHFKIEAADTNTGASINTSALRTTGTIEPASREEFEEVSAEYKIEQAKLTAARQKLLLLGMSAKQLDDLRDSNQTGALISVEAPASGAILSRSVNQGEVATMGKELFRIADLSTVWVIGQIYEKDFAEARVGAPV